eukprot:m.113168 g.113168  ORF g.113168 m.113168 type:complete len:435 (+) comp14122_c0_seq4:1753-3057(+)
MFLLPISSRKLKEHAQLFSSRNVSSEVMGKWFGEPGSSKRVVSKDMLDANVHKQLIQKHPDIQCYLELNDGSLKQGCWLARDVFLAVWAEGANQKTVTLWVAVFDGELDWHPRTTVIDRKLVDGQSKFAYSPELVAQCRQQAGYKEAWGEKAEQQGPVLGDDGLPVFPWHLINIWWKFPESCKDFCSLDIDISISCNVSSDDLNLYIAPIGLGQINGVAFYGGIQTNIGGDRVSDLGKEGAYHKGKGAIFSRWAAGGCGIDVSYVRAAADGYVESAGYEGDFCSGRRPYVWNSGEYTYSVRKSSYEKDKSGKEWTWVDAVVTDKATGCGTFVASIKFPGRTLEFWGKNSAFVEIYGGQKVNIADLPSLQVRMGNLRINGTPAQISELYAVHPTRGPVSPRIMSAEMDHSSSDVIMTMHNKAIQSEDKCIFISNK